MSAFDNATLMITGGTGSFGSTMADESYTSHNTTRLDVEGTVKKILTTEYVQNALKGIPNV